MTTLPQSHALRSARCQEAQAPVSRLDSPGPDATAHLEPPKRLALSVTEAAKLLGISRALAYELVARGELPAVRLGRRVVVPRVALLAMFGAPGPGAT